VRVVAVFVGRPRTVSTPAGKLRTGGAKARVEAAFIGMGGFENDAPANLKYHGGSDRTACVYPAEHYPWWKAQEGWDLAPGGFCENLTVEGALEHDICIGDIFRVGKALLQVSIARDPCATLDKLTGIDGLAARARGSGKCGFHMRTLEEGLVRAGDPFDLVQRHPAGFTLARVLDLFHGRSRDRELAARLTSIAEFAAQGKGMIAKLL
jgi:MOSC domain-containing protein YiiM